MQQGKLMLVDFNSRSIWCWSSNEIQIGFSVATGLMLIVSCLYVSLFFKFFSLQIHPDLSRQLLKDGYRLDEIPDDEDLDLIPPKAMGSSICCCSSDGPSCCLQWTLPQRFSSRQHPRRRKRNPRLWKGNRRRGKRTSVSRRHPTFSRTVFLRRCH